MAALLGSDVGEFIRPTPELAEQARTALAFAFQQLGSSAATSTSGPPAELYVQGFDLEQIWQQVVLFCVSGIMFSQLTQNKT